MATTLSELGDYLEAQSVGTVGTNIFLGKLPASPVTAMALIQYPGRQPEIWLSTGGAINTEFPRFQFLSRAASDTTALANAQTAYQKLATVANKILGSTFYSTITALQTPGLLHRDTNDNVVFSFNFECEKALSS